MTRFNSLLGPSKFPVPMRSELARKSLNLALDSRPNNPVGGPCEQKYPVYSQLAGNLAFRDEFAEDCLLQRGVCDEAVPGGGPAGPTSASNAAPPGILGP